jgi:hypothetical protein
MDAYDEAVDYFTVNPDKIPLAWNNPDKYPGGFLFSLCHRSRYGWMEDEYGLPYDGSCPITIGCPVMIREDLHYKAETPEITDRIRKDSRIPKTVLMPKHLHHLANVQRRTDKELGREAPVFTLDSPAFTLT